MKKEIKSYLAILLATSILGFLCASSFCQAATESKIFTKKEILFLNWGKSNNEVGLTKKTLKPYQGGGINYFYPTDFGIDGEENLYILDAPNNKIKVFSKNGDFIKSFDNELPNIKMLVGQDGEVYLPIYADSFKKHWVLRIKKNGEQIKYTGELGEYVEGNTMYRWDGKPVMVFEDKKNNDFSNEPPHLYREKDVTQDNLREKKIYIKTKQINKFLNLNDNPDLELPIVQKKNMWTHGPEVIGVDKKGNIYLHYNFEWARALVEEDLYVYSSQGKLIGNIQFYDKPATREHYREDFIKISNEGNVYQMLILEDGVHLFEWQKQ